MRLLFELGSEHVEAINAVSGDRCIPHPHVFSDRLLRPGDQAFFDIIHSFMGYRTCYYRTFAVGGVNQAQVDAYRQCREWLDNAIERFAPASLLTRSPRSGRRAEELGFPSEEACFGLQFGHGLGVGLYESPMIRGCIPSENPIEIEVGMVFALETYCPASDGRSAARIEEEVLVTRRARRSSRGSRPTNCSSAGRRLRPRRRLHRGRTLSRRRPVAQTATVRRPARRPRGEGHGPGPRARKTRRGRAKGPSRPAPEEPAVYLELYRRMLLIRGFEELVQSLFMKGEVHGTTHLYVGQEANATGVGSVLGPEDRVAGTYRGHGHALGVGVEPQALLDEMLGRATGVCGGRAGSMNVIDLEHRLIGSFGIIGASIGAAVGAALSSRRMVASLSRSSAKARRITATSTSA